MSAGSFDLTNLCVPNYTTQLFRLIFCYRKVLITFQAHESDEPVNQSLSLVEQLRYQQESLLNESMQLKQGIQASYNIFTMNGIGFHCHEAECRDNNTQLVAAKHKIDELQEVLVRSAARNKLETKDAVAEEEVKLSRLREFACGNNVESSLVVLQSFKQETRLSSVVQRSWKLLLMAAAMRAESAKGKQTSSG